MTGKSGGTKTLGAFLHDNSELFTLLGVFGAISLYMAQFPVKERSIWLDVGLVSSLLMFIMVSISIHRRLAIEFDSNAFDFLITPKIENARYVIFFIPFYFLIISVTIIVLRFPTPLSIVSQTLSAFFGISSTVWFLVNLLSLIGLEDIGPVGRDPRVERFIKVLLSISLMIIVGSYGVIQYLDLTYSYTLVDLINLKPGPGIVPFLISYVFGIFLGGLLYFFMGITLFIGNRLVHLVYHSDNTEELISVIRAIRGERTPDGQSTIDEFEND